MQLLGHSAAGHLRRSSLFASLDESDLAGLNPAPEVIYVRAGEVLMRQGERSSDYYHLIDGRLRVFKEDEPGRQTPVVDVKPGEGVGEMSFLTGDPRSATVIARVDSKLVRFRQSTLLKLIERHSSTALEIARVVMQRLGKKSSQASYPRIAILPLQRSVDSRAIASALAGELARFGASSVIDSAACENPFEDEADSVGYAVYDAGHERDQWSRRCFDYADLILFVVEAGSGCPTGDVAYLSPEADRNLLGRIDLLIVHPGGWHRKPGTAAWIKKIAPQEHHHIQTKRQADMARLARIIAGRAINLVLGGGGARGFAEFGVIRALKESGIPIDRVCGPSMGAFVGAILAYDGSFNTLAALTRDCFRRRRPAKDYTLPMLSALRGRRMQQIAMDVVGDWLIEDLPIRYFCLSAHLSNAEIVTHFEGLVWVALRASGALPVVGPPLLMGQQILIDGGALNNLPVDLMKQRFSGTNIVVDVTVNEPMRMDPKWELRCPSGFEILWDKIKPFGQRLEIPHIFDVLYRSMILSTQSRWRETREMSDWLIEPPVAGYSIFDFDDFDKLVAVGYQHTLKLLDEMKADAALLASRGLQNLF